MLLLDIIMLRKKKTMQQAMNTTIDVTSGGGTHTRIKYEDDYTQEEHDVANTMITMQQEMKTKKKREKWAEMAGGNDVVMLYCSRNENFDDGIEKQNLETINYIWEGQKKVKKYDQIVKNAKLIIIWYRVNGKTEYKFIGYVIKKKVIQERNETNTLKMKFKICKRPDILPYLTKVPFYNYKENNDKQATKSKKNSFEMLGMKTRKLNWSHGIMVGY